LVAAVAVDLTEALQEHQVIQVVQVVVEEQHQQRLEVLELLVKDMLAALQLPLQAVVAVVQAQLALMPVEAMWQVMVEQVLHLQYRAHQ
jgi:hypothetical protein